jgi:membrane protease subunit HflK
VRERAQRLLDAEDLGVRVASVRINDVQMPASVQPAQRDMTKAAAERASGIDAARAYAATVLPKAKAEAERLVHEAQVARAPVAAAEAEAAPGALVPPTSRLWVTRRLQHRDYGVDPSRAQIVNDTRGGAGAT